MSGLGDGAEVPFRVPIGHERVRPSEAAPAKLCNGVLKGAGLYRTCRL